MFVLPKFFSNIYLRKIAFWLCVLAVSFLGGYVGANIAENTLLVSKTEDVVRPLIVQDRPQNGQQTSAASNVILQSMQSSMFALYDLKNLGGAMTPDMLPPDSSLQGFALAVTSDGWLVTTYPLHPGEQNIKVVSSRGKVYQITGQVSDTFSGLTFVKISETQVQPIDFPSFNDEDFMGDGYLVSGWSSLSRTIIDAPRYKKTQLAHDYLRTTKKLNKMIRPDDSFALFCMPLVGPHNQIVGCTSQTGIIPFKYLHGVLDSVLHGSVLQEHDLVLTYIDLSSVPVRLSDASESRAGAYLVLGKGGMPLRQADGTGVALQTGDIITRINGDTVDSHHDLSELLSQYVRGDRLTLTILSHLKEHDYHITFN